MFRNTDEAGASLERRECPPFTRLHSPNTISRFAHVESACLLLQIQVHNAHQEGTYTDDDAGSMMSLDGSAFGRQSDVFPVTAPLRPIRFTERDLQMLPRPRGSRSESDAGLTPDIAQEHDRSSTRQVSIALPIHIRKPIGLLLGSLLVKDLSTCISTWKAAVPFLPSMLVSKQTC